MALLDQVLAAVKSRVGFEITDVCEYGVLTLRVKETPQNKVTVSIGPLDHEADKIVAVQGWMKLCEDGNDLPATMPVIFTKPELAAQTAAGFLKRIQQTSR